MRNVKMFLASGNSLKKDRDEVMLFLANKNQYLVKHGIFLELVRWEFLSSSFSETRKQDDFDNEVKTSEIFTCLIFDKIGKYTKEEFETAYQNYKDGLNPKKFYLYFKILPKNKKEKYAEVLSFRAKIEEEEQIYRDYKNPDQLKVFLGQNLDQDLPEILRLTIQDYILNQDTVPETQNVPEYILDNLEDADKMLNQKLTRNAKEIYEESLKQISKHTQPFLYAKVKRNLAKSIIDLACESDDEENQIRKAIVYLEEVVQIFDPSIHSEELAQTYIHIGEGYNWLAFFREKKENLFKAIEATKKAIDILKNIPKSPIYIKSLYGLGCRYRELASLSNLEQDALTGLEYFTKSLSLSDPSKDPVYYCYIQREMAQTYLILRRMNPPKEMKDDYTNRILEHCKKGIDVISIEKNPRQYASMLSMKASILFSVSCETKDSKLLTESIDLYRESISISKKYLHSVNYLSQLFQFISCWLEKFRLMGDSKDLEEFKHYINEAFQISSIDTHPYYFASFKYLESSYFWMLVKKIDQSTQEKITHIRLAISSLGISLSVFTKESYLINYIKTKNQIANYFFTLYKLTKDPGDLEKTIIELKDGLAPYQQGLLNTDSIYDLLIELESDIKLEKEKCVM